MGFWIPQNAKNLTGSRTGSQGLRKDRLRGFSNLVGWLLVGEAPPTRYKHDCLDITIPNTFRFSIKRQRLLNTLLLFIYTIVTKTVSLISVQNAWQKKN